MRCASSPLNGSNTAAADSVTVPSSRWMVKPSLYYPSSASAYSTAVTMGFSVRQVKNVSRRVSFTTAINVVDDDRTSAAVRVYLALSPSLDQRFFLRGVSVRARRKPSLCPAPGSRAAAAPTRCSPWPGPTRGSLSQTPDSPRTDPARGTRAPAPLRGRSRSPTPSPPAP
eukprot:1180714-Prorocentrum_minimum.AAC.1